MTTLLPLYFIHYTVCSVGILSNSLLLVLIATRTPKEMRSYGAILFTSSFAELLTVSAGAFFFMRLIPIEDSAVINPIGLCAKVGSASTCFYVFSLMVWGQSLNPFLLVICFCYRLYLVLYGNPSETSVATALLILVSLSSVIYLSLGSVDQIRLEYLLSKSNLDLEEFGLYIEEIKLLLVPFTPDLVSVAPCHGSSVPSIFTPRVFIAVFWVVIPIFPCYAVILVVGRRLLAELANKSSYMSDKTRSAHKEIVKGLIIQSALSAINVITMCSYLLMQLNVVDVGAFGLVVQMCGTFVVSTNPLISLYFVRPYRQALVRVVKRGEDSVITVKTSSDRMNNNAQ